MAAPAHLIVWDLDRTLGVFDGLEHVRDPGLEISVLLRPGIDAALCELSRAGFAHSVLTLATPDYAELALRGTGLRHHFLEVACQGQRPKGDAEGIAATFGLPFDELGDRLLFVGDHVLLDVPQDPRVVFHLEAYALRRPAAELVALVLALRERGKGSIRAGFDAIAAGSSLEGELGRATVEGAGRLLLLARTTACPVLAFDDDEQSEEQGELVRFVPAEAHPELAARLWAASSG
jgi:hypothetical protein